jgi:hypothetical protein
LHKSIIIGACLYLLILVVPIVAHADQTTESFTVFTDKSQYYVGDPVNVYVQANSIDPNNTITVTAVVVYDPTNVSVAQWDNLTITLANNTTIQYVGTVFAETQGQYTVTANATGCPWTLHARCCFTCQYYHGNTVPELPFGSIVATLAFAGATGLYITRKRRYKPEK